MSSPLVTRHRLATLAVAALFPLGAVACGSSGKTTKTGSGGGGASSTTAGHAQTSTTKSGGYGY